MPSSPEAFIARWSASAASERANYALFLAELCDVLEVPHPMPAGPDTSENAYVFERGVPLRHKDGSVTQGRIDLYKRGCFVLEAKQYSSADSDASAESKAEAQLAAAVSIKTAKGKLQRNSDAWGRAMQEARAQAERYARSLPQPEPTPPFLLVVDVGHSIELHADFSQQGKAYQQFPEPRTHRILLKDLAKSETRELLRAIWEDPYSLDPARRSAAVTRQAAEHLAALAKSFEQSGHPARLVAEFLTRCLFCMFAEDVGLLPARSFSELLSSIKDQPQGFVPLAEQLFKELNTGTPFSTVLRVRLLHFNGGLFADHTALPVNKTQLSLLIESAKLQWKHVEPAIFGTLLERALDPVERHKLGAHYTPRAYVERLVLPTVIEPLREDWVAVQTTALAFAEAGKLPAAIKEVQAFQKKLTSLTILDPACGSGNFLYVTLEHMKRLEGEVLEQLSAFGENQELLQLHSVTVDPHQFLGIELNPRAASIAELVLWIGYLQWHYRVHGSTMPAEPVLRKFNNIECRDAVLDYDERIYAKDENGDIRYAWDRRTFKTDPITGKQVPDETAQTAIEHFVNPRPAEWPQSDYIVGNPPFLGSKRMREVLGDGYVDALQAAWPDVPKATDYVMRWWHYAAILTRSRKVQRFGFITTNSFGQEYIRRAAEPHLSGSSALSIVYAIPDHPWVDSADGAAVRIAMTVCTHIANQGTLDSVVGESAEGNGEVAVTIQRSYGKIQADLSIGANVVSARRLKSNAMLCSVGMKTIGSAFQVTYPVALSLGLNKRIGLEQYIRPYINCRDFYNRPRGIWLIDFFGLSEAELRSRFPEAYHHLLTEAKPGRLINRNKNFAKLWWIIGHPRQQFRNFTHALRRFISTGETSKHRVFGFLGREISPDSTLVTFGLDDSFHLGVLSSKIHVVYSLAAGGNLGAGNDPRYNKVRCFETFPFPDCTNEQKVKIRELAEELDSHHKRAQGEHKLGLTAIYNVLNKARIGAPLNSKEKNIHRLGLVSILQQIRDELDAAVASAYGWSWPLPDEDILELVVTLNARRAAEEANGKILWLRPEYQSSVVPDTLSDELDDELELDGLPADLPKKNDEITENKHVKFPWPKERTDQVRLVEQALKTARRSLTAEELTTHFSRPSKKAIKEILSALLTLGRIHEGTEPGTFQAG